MPDVAFVGPRGKQDILTYLAERGTDLTDEAVQTGSFGMIAGLDFMFSTVGDITTHNAILVDTDRYGYEATFTPVETEEESDFATDTERFKVRTRKGFKAIKPEAAIEVEGSRVSPMNDRRLRALRAERQRSRMIRLLEELADVKHERQCADCGEFFSGLAQHRPHCDGPDR